MSDGQLSILQFMSLDLSLLFKECLYGLVVFYVSLLESHKNEWLCGQTRIILIIANKSKAGNFFITYEELELLFLTEISQTKWFERSFEDHFKLNQYFQSGF